MRSLPQGVLHLSEGSSHHTMDVPDDEEKTTTEDATLLMVEWEREIDTSCIPLWTCCAMAGILGIGLIRNCFEEKKSWTR